VNVNFITGLAETKSSYVYPYSIRKIRILLINALGFKNFCFAEFTPYIAENLYCRERVQKTLLVEGSFYILKRFTFAASLLYLLAKP